MKRNSLIIGNGSIGIDSSTDKCYINNRTGDFLLNLKRQKIEILYVEPISNFDFHNNLQNFCLQDHNIPFIALNSKKGMNTVHLIVKIVRLIKKHDFIYIFLPGNLGKLIGLISIILFKPYGIYLRGEVDLSFVNNLIFKRSDFILTVSPMLKEAMAMMQDKVECIRPMIDIKIQDIQIKKYHYNNPLTILYVGNISYGKGVMEIIDIAQKFNESNIIANFRLVGGGQLFKELSVNNTIKNVIFTGQIADSNKLLDEYKKADFFFFPSHSEGFPRVLFEAMSQSLPIFTTMVGGIPGYMRTGVNCIEIPPKNSTEQFNILTNSMRNVSLMNAVAQGGRECVTDVLTNSTSHDVLFKKYFIV